MAFKSANAAWVTRQDTENQESRVTVEDMYCAPGSRILQTIMWPPGGEQTGMMMDIVE